MEKDAFPQFNLFPRIKRAGEAIASALRIHPEGALAYRSTHYRGASEMLDQALDEQLTLEFGE